ncbi:MAG TPA: preprotein translocase subunit YajC [Acidimicrobiales bacterium]|nr:preprotein translocase subunit YajC [Acidimicrobiales bacterium]
MGLVPFALILVAMWLFLVRPQQQRVRAQRDLLASLSVGDEVVTAGGVIGRIVELDDKQARIEVAPGVTLTFLRAAVSRKITPEADAVPEAPAIEDTTEEGSD